MEESPGMMRSRRRGGVRGRGVTEVLSSVFILSAFCLLHQVQSIPIYHQSHSEPQFRHRGDNLQHQTQLPRPDLHLHPRVAKQNPPFRNPNNENGYWSPNDRYEELSLHPPPPLNNFDYERHPSFPQPQHQQQHPSRNHNHNNQHQPHRQIPPPHHHQHQPQHPQHPPHLPNPNPTPYLKHKQHNNVEHPSWNPQINNHQEFHHPNQFQKPLFHQNGHQEHGPHQSHFNPEPIQYPRHVTRPQQSTFPDQEQFVVGETGPLEQKRQQFASHQFQSPSPTPSPRQFQDFGGDKSNFLDSVNYPHHQLRDGDGREKSGEVANEVDAFVDGSEDEDHRVRSRSRFIRTSLNPNPNTETDTVFVHKSESGNNLEEDAKINSGSGPGVAVAAVTDSSNVKQVEVEGTCTLTCSTPINVNISGKRMVVIMDESASPETLETTMETEDP